MQNIEKLPRNSRINGRYLVKRRIGTGWEGVTYLVRDRLDGRPKAVKFITNTTRRKALLAQARVMVRLEHPNVIKYYNVDQIDVAGDRHYFLLMEYLEGPRLSQLITQHFRRADQPPLFDYLRIFYQICRGMAYVHERRLLHDDLHSDNLLVTGAPELPGAGVLLWCRRFVVLGHVGSHRVRGRRDRIHGRCTRDSTGRRRHCT